MVKKIILAWVTTAFVLGALGMGMAADQGNKRRGKYIYRKVYKSCHQRGEVESPKPIMNPDSKTMKEWTLVFEKKDFKEFRCQEEWDKLSEKDLLDIYTYLHAHAFDSPTPAKCK